MDPEGAHLPLTWTSLAETPTRWPRFDELVAAGPPFLAELTGDHRRLLRERWPGHQWLASVEGGGAVVAVQALAIRWDGTTEDAPGAGVGALIGGADPSAADADTLVVLDVAVHPEVRGRGYGTQVLAALDRLSGTVGLERLLVLLRTHAKRHHPLVPFARYLSAVDGDGRPRDGWLAAAWESGLHPVRGVDRSFVSRAPVAAWERWYGRPFPTSGPYLVPGAIKPAIVELERDEGRYREPHLWVAPREHLRQRTVVTSALRSPADGWRRALAAAGVVAGSRRHREVRRPR
jgi:GNAT superfamily N-acetyltransferase